MHPANQPRSGLNFFGVGKEIAVAHPPSFAPLARSYPHIAHRAGCIRRLS
ncbi:MAG: hypothetical protein LBR52_01800 [Prevotellaceae bacterium]|nr:hypothetical protein [Prevotellaceae bacterium]